MERTDPGILQQTLDENSRMIEAAESRSEINGIVERLIAELADAEFASLWIFDEKRGALTRERDDRSLNEISIQEQQGIIARSFLTMSGGIYNYLASEKEYVPRFDNPDNIRIKSKVIVPLVDGERFLGLATAYSSVRRIRNFSEEDLKLMEALAPFLTEAIYKIRPELRETRVEPVYMDTSLRHQAKAVTERVEAIQTEGDRERGKKERPDELLGFLADTVHDIRTPANTLYGFLELLEDRIDDSRLLQYLRNAKESAQFINELTTSILDRVSLRFAAAEERSVVNPIKFFSDIASTFSANMYEKSIAYNVFLDPGLPAELRLDPFRLKRVVINLIGNAWKFTPRGRSIGLNVEYNGGEKRLRISVTDKGIGIAEEKQKKIFEAFSQAEESTSLEYGGTGLGLSISARFVAEMGGRLDLESALDQGSCFSFEIPVEAVDETSRFPVPAVVPRRVDILMGRAHSDIVRNLLKYLLRLGLKREKLRIVTSVEKLDDSSTHLIAFSSLITPEDLNDLHRRGVSILLMEEELFSLAGDPKYKDFTLASVYGSFLPELYALLVQTAVGAKRSRNVLVVDDNRINIELLRAILEEELYRVETAQNGKEALEIMLDALERGDPFSLAFVDRHLPGLSGPELMQRFRTAESRLGAPNLYAVSITGDPEEDREERILYNRIMRKPFKRHEVKSILQNLEKDFLSSSVS